ncbi:glycosyltransferase [Candidatus Gracilibacteria bacterium]|nr:glycosyltransferase [Candidatus Gracilibacteria bacterium]
MQKNKELHITYIGRLEKEKGIDILIECIDRSILEERNIIWHICGTGSYLQKFKSYNKPYILLYGYTQRDELDILMKKTDLVLMPSLFLETFGLVALETLLRGVPVCGFPQGGLQDFIHPLLALNIKNPVDSFFKILDKNEFPLLDVGDFSYELWIEKLSKITEGSHKILLVTDYLGRIGGAEEYIYFLGDELRGLGKEVEYWGCQRKVNRYMRIFYMFTAPLAFWRGISLSKKLQEYSPDLVWMHSIMRYIGPYGLAALSRYDCKKYITHHDLGLISPRPSKIYHQSDIPKTSNLGDWISKNINILLVLFVLWKWLMVTWIWIFLKRDNITHILPSFWMQKYFSLYGVNDFIIFPHTSKIQSNQNVKKTNR